MSDLSGDALVASMLADGEAQAAPKKEKLLPLIAVVGVLTLVALAGGAGLGIMLGSSEAPPVVAETPAGAEPATPEVAAVAVPGAVPTTQIIKLEPIVTNVSSPAKILVRVEASIVIDPSKTTAPDLLAAEVQSDTLTFLRTLDLAQIEGARGLLHLREDLRERAMLRSPAVSDYLILALAAAFVAMAAPALAQEAGGDLAGSLSSLIPAGDAAISGRIVQLFGIVTVLSIAPGLLVMVTSFTRIVVALSILRTGLGMQSTPANLILISLSLFMTFFIMSPTFDQAWREGLKPLLDNEITEQEAFVKISDPFRDFMLTQVRPKDLQLFNGISDATRRDRVEPGAQPETPPSGEAATGEAEVVDLRILVPAFMISELRRGFEIGFLIVLPFLVIDLIVATLTMSMGMMMLPPTIISLPFKILFFVLIDGWNMLTGSLVRSFF
jgi:flagellar biosynthetic protein FliP